LKDIGNRTKLFSCLVGSHNYNLNTPKSDYDYKLFFSPTFDDLYNKKQFSKMYIGEKNDIEVHDIRKVCKLWFKSNVNYLEVLFTNGFEFELNENMSFEKDIENTRLIAKIFRKKNEIARINLPYLYNACVGMHFSRVKRLKKGSENTQDLIKEYGYCTKNALHAYRILDFLERFKKTKYSDFKAAIYYKDRSILDIKYGKYTLKEFKKVIKEKHEKIKELKEDYMSYDPNKELQNKIESIVKKIVKLNLIKEESNE